LRVINFGLALAHLTHFKMTFRDIVFAFIAQYLCLDVANRVWAPQIIFSMWIFSNINLTIGSLYGNSTGCFASNESSDASNLQLE